MFNFPYAPVEEIKENRINLENLFPESRLLNYLDICGLEKGLPIIYLSKDSKKQEEYERRFGDFSAPTYSLFNYNQALKSAIKKLELFKTIKVV